MPPVSRAGESADSLAGVTPRVVFSPATVGDAQEVLRLCAREKMSVAFAGGRTDIELGAPPLRLDALVDTRQLNRVIEYAPSDMVLVAEAGVTLQQVQDLAAKEGQRLAMDPPFPARATLGGIVAANQFGPLRARYGSVRDLIIGVGLVRADGVLAHGGGKVVKNVAGFDLPKLSCNSLGTLGLIATVNFRLHPLPEQRRTVRARGCSAAQVLSLLAEATRAQLEPCGAVALREGAGPFDLLLRFEGFAAGVAQQTARALSLCQAGAAEAATLDDAAAEEQWARHDLARTQGATRLKLTALPTDFGGAEATLLAPLAGALRGARTAWYATLGIAFISGDCDAAAAPALRAALTAARAALHAQRGSLTLLAAPAEVRAGVDVWGPPPPGFALMQRLKARFDPERRLAPGRAAGGL